MELLQLKYFCTVANMKISHVPLRSILCHNQPCQRLFPPGAWLGIKLLNELAIACVIEKKEFYMRIEIAEYCAVLSVAMIRTLIQQYSIVT